MNWRLPVLSALVATVLTLGITRSHADPAAAADHHEMEHTMVSHMVYFKLKEDTDETRAKLVEGCTKHLKGKPGQEFFAAGVGSKDFAREVNMSDWQVALNVVFRDKAAYDAYETAPYHLKFIEENKDLWAGVVVYDSYVSK